MRNLLPLLLLVAAPVFAQPGAPTPAPAATLTEAQTRALDGALSGMLAEQTLGWFRPEPTCHFEMRLSGNPKKRDRGVRVVVRPIEAKDELQYETGFALGRIHTDAFQKKIKKGADDQLGKFRLAHVDEFSDEVETVIPYDEFLKLTTEIDQYAYFAGIGDFKGASCFFLPEERKRLFEFRNKLK